MTDEELEKLKRNRLVDRPKVYDAVTKEYETITADLEDYLILLSASVKDEMTTLLGKSKEAAEEKTDEEELRALFMESETDLVDERVNRLNSTTTEIETFLPKLKQETEPTDLGPLRQTIQQPTAYQIFDKSRMLHLQKFLNTLSILIEEGSSEVATSWIEAINKYKGVQ